jgi:hypothetical protein
MKGFSLLEHGRQVVLTGVEGAGRNSFASLYFPEMQQREKTIRLSRRTKRLVVVVMLDSRHLQNLAEEKVLNAVAKARKRNWKRVSVRVLLVLGRIDCVCDRHQNRQWVEEVMCGYKPYLKSLRVGRAAVVAHSNLAVARLADLLAEDIDDDDMDDIKHLLSKCGRRLPRTLSKDNAKEFLVAHCKTLQMLSGEYPDRRFL